MKATQIALVALLAGGLAGSASASDLWLHVEVKDAGSDAANVHVNIPFGFVEGAVALLPATAARAHKLSLDDHDISVPQLRELWRQLATQPDATLVTVDASSGDHVRVAKEKGYLVVHARDRHTGDHGEGDEVHVRIPAEVVDALLSGQGDELDVAAGLRALAAHGEGELVTVTGDDEHVRVWVDSRSEGR